MDDYPHWWANDNRCPACEQRDLLYTRLNEGDAALHERIQAVWPLDAEAAFGAIPTPLRLHADPRFTGKGSTIALIDTGFYPHPDLTQPENRIRAWVDSTVEPVDVRTFGRKDTPTWPNWDHAYDRQWHGTMTSVVAAGNGYLSHGLYRGLASSADVVLIQARPHEGWVGDGAILRALDWISTHHEQFNIKVVNISLPGEDVPLADNLIDSAIADLVGLGVVVVVAAGNDGVRQLVPPATAPHALTIGGLDDHNLFDHEAVSLWHSNYGSGELGVPKPELVAPSIWVAAPVLPRSEVAGEADGLFQRRGEDSAEKRIHELKLITPHYQHADGTSFSAPIVGSAVACLLEANPTLTPPLVRQILQQSALPIEGVSAERQGAGALTIGQAVALALHHTHAALTDYVQLPRVNGDTVTFLFHDHAASQVRILGSWNDWAGAQLEQVEAGVWQYELPRPAEGHHPYKLLLDETHWVTDPSNPLKIPDGFGGFNSLLKL